MNQPTFSSRSIIDEVAFIGCPVTPDVNTSTFSNFFIIPPLSSVFSSILEQNFAPRN